MKKIHYDSNTSFASHTVPTGTGLQYEVTYYYTHMVDTWYVQDTYPVSFRYFIQGTQGGCGRVVRGVMLEPVGCRVDPRPICLHCCVPMLLMCPISV